MKMRMKSAGNNPSEVTSLTLLAGGVYPMGRIERVLSADSEIEVAGPGARVLIRAFINLYTNIGENILVLHDGLDSRLITTFKDEMTGPLAALPTPDPARQFWINNAQRAVFGALTACEVAGLWLASQRAPAANLIPRNLPFGELDFDPDAFLDYAARVRLTQRRLAKLRYLPAALGQLNAGIFRHQSLEDCQTFVSGHLTDFLARAEKLLADYADALTDRYRRRRGEMRREVAHLQAALLKARSGRAAKLDELRTEHGRIRPFAAQWPDRQNRPAAADLTAWLADYEDQLIEWAADLRTRLREEQIGLSLAAVAPEYKTRWENLIQRQDELLQAINDSGLLQRPLPTPAGTIGRRQKAVGQLLDTLRGLQRELPLLPDFYDWQKNWFALPAELRRVLGVLRSTPEVDWEAAFSAWYLESGLTRTLDAAVRPDPPAGLPLPLRPSADRVYFRGPGEELPAAPFALVVRLGESRPPQALPSTAVLSLLRATATPNSHYVFRYGYYRPGLAFTQNWTGPNLPDWSWGEHPRSRAETIAAIADFFGDTPERAATYLPTGRGGLLVAETDAMPYLVRPGQVLPKPHRALLILTSLAAIPPELAQNFTELWTEAETLRILVTATNEEITEALLTDGYHARFALAATLRACEAIRDGDRPAFGAMAREVRHRLGVPRRRTDPLCAELLAILTRRFPRASHRAEVPWRDLILPVVMTQPNGQKTVFLPDDHIPGADTLGVEIDRRGELRTAGFNLFPVYTEDLLAGNWDTIFSGLTSEVASSDLGRRT